jgi:hypothetical protein
MMFRFVCFHGVLTACIGGRCGALSGLNLESKFDACMWGIHARFSECEVRKGEIIAWHEEEDAVVGVGVIDCVLGDRLACCIDGLMGAYMACCTYGV